MTSRVWVVAIRRRLFLRVSPRGGMCITCKKDRIDIRGEHQVTCSGRGGLIMRHDSIKELLKQQIERCSYDVQFEKNAGSDDRSKPGDLKVLRWREGRDHSPNGWYGYGFRTRTSKSHFTFTHTRTRTYFPIFLFTHTCSVPQNQK